MEILFLPFVIMFGLCVGSFLNVCIYRLPRKESIVYPRSRCPQCKNDIRWYDNIPLVSYVILGRRCRFCRVQIPFRYFFVELMTGLLFWFLFGVYGMSAVFVIYALFFSGLIVVAAIDFKYREIPDVISVSGIVAGLLLSVLFPSLQAGTGRGQAFVYSLLGILVGGATIYAIGVVGKLIFRKEAMGGGDVKLLAMIGAFMGWKLAVMTFFIAPFLGTFYGLIVKIKTGESLIPYGPFLSMASFIALIWGKDILKLLLFY
jgi:leader peptidase (prepilin peptidase)/N-methyltransferase